MYFTKFISFFLLASLLAAPSLCEPLLDGKIWMTDITQSLTFICKSVRSLGYNEIIAEIDLHDRELSDRALKHVAEPVTNPVSESNISSKAPRKGPILHSHGKTSTSCRRAARELFKRTDMLIVEGTVHSAGLADALNTRQLRTCIGLVAVSSTKHKVMAHINAIDATSGRDYQSQTTAFISATQVLGGKLEVYASFPTYTAARGNKGLETALGEMIEYIDEQVRILGDYYGAVDRDSSLDANGRTMSVSIIGGATIDGRVI